MSLGTFFRVKVKMLNTILGTKQEMEQSFVDGERVAATVIQAGPCVVTQIKTKKKDGYWGLQLGFGTKKIKNITKPLRGHLRGVTKDKGKQAPRFLREVRFEQEPKNRQGVAFKVGDTIKVSDIFSVGDRVSVTGISKGKGFAGVVKRWGFAGGPKTHGQGDRHRSPGSIGQGTTPGRVRKGKKMAGRMGTDRIMVENLKVVSADLEDSRISVSGPVPGSPGGLLIIKKTASSDKDGQAREETK